MCFLLHFKKERNGDKLKEEKTTRIKKAFIDGLIEPTRLQTELNSIEKEYKER